VVLKSTSAVASEMSPRSRGVGVGVGVRVAGGAARVGRVVDGLKVVVVVALAVVVVDVTVVVGARRVLDGRRIVWSSGAHFSVSPRKKQ